MTRSEYAAAVYELLAADQASDDLRYDGDVTIAAASIQVRCAVSLTAISFPDPYNDCTAVIAVSSFQPSTVVAAIVEGLLTAFAPYLTSFTAQTPQCCGQLMQQLQQRLSSTCGMPVVVQRTFRCEVCDDYQFACVTEESAADRLVSEVH